MNDTANDAMDDAMNDAMNDTMNDTVTARRVVVVHSSDEMYGADRVLIQVVEAIGAIPATEVEVWLPADVDHGATPLCHELERRGVAVRHLDLPVLRRALLTPQGLARLARQARALQRELEARPCDLVYCMTSACLPAAPAARAAGVPAVALHVQEMWSKREGTVLRALARATTLRITISGAVDRAAGLCGPDSTVVTNAVAGPEVQPRPAGSSGEPLRFVIASRWNSWKGHATLLEAWGRAGCPGHLTILGGPPPVGRRVDVPALVAALVPDPSTVEVVGEVPSSAPYIAAADVLVVPSDAPEPFGLVAIEAFAQGRPVVASRAGGVVDIVTNDVDGWLFPPTDVAALADVLASLTPDRVADAGRRARASYLARYTPDLFAARITGLVAAELDRVRPLGTDLAEAELAVAGRSAA